MLSSGLSTGGETGDGRALSRDEIYDVLGNQRRRCVLHYLLGIEETTTVDTLSRQIAGWENAVAPEQVSSQQRKRVYTALRQTHLPKLRSVGVVEYDTDRGTVSLTEAAGALQPFLAVTSEDIPWTVYYLSIGTVGVVAVGLAAIGVPPFASVPGLGYAAAVALLVVASAAVQVYSEFDTRVGRDAALAELRATDSRGSTGSLSPSND